MNQKKLFSTALLILSLCNIFKLHAPSGGNPGSAVSPDKQDSCNVSEAIPALQQCAVLRGCISGQWVMQFSQDSKSLVTSCNCQIKMWQVNNDGNWILTNEIFNPTPKMSPMLLECSPDGQNIILASVDGVNCNIGDLKVFSIDESNKICNFQVVGKDIYRNLVFSPTGQCFIAINWSAKNIDMYKKDSAGNWINKSIAIPAWLPLTICAKYSPAGNQFFLGGSNGKINVFDCDREMFLQDLAPINHGDVRDFAFTTCGIRAITLKGIEEQDPVKIWQLKPETAEWECIGSIDDDFCKILYRAKFSHDGKYVLSTQRNIARILDVASGTKIFELQLPSPIHNASLSPDNKWLVLGQEEKIQIYATGLGIAA